MVVAAAVVVSVGGWRLYQSRLEDGPVAITRSAGPTAGTEGPCGRFAAALPQTLGTLERRDARPAHPGWTAYGSPAIEVRCGVAPSARYRPGDQLISVNDVAWYADESVAGGVDFSLPRSVLNVSVWIPEKYRAELLSLLSAAVVTAQPL